MKIVFVITRSDEIGGAQVHVRDITSQMVEDGHDVTVLVGGDGPLVGLLEENKVKVVIIKNMIREISPVNDFKAYFQIKKALNIIQPDLVTTHSSKAGLLGRLAAKSCGCPVIFTAHGWAFTDGVSPIKKIFYRQVERIGAHFSDKIINVSEKDRQLAIKNNIGRPDLHVTIHNGIRELEIKKNIEDNILHNIFYGEKKGAVNVDIKERQEELGQILNKKRVVKFVMVARFSAPKDHETLFKALSELRGYNWCLRLVGTGPKLDKMKKLVKVLKIDSRVEFMGERFDIPRILDESDVFVLTTKWEGLPISIIEAMRAGLPIIASDVGGVCEQLDNKLSWGLVEHANVKQLKSKLKILCKDHEKLRKLGSYSRLKYRESFSFSKMYSENFKLYSQYRKM